MYHPKRLLITGGCGFIGSNFIHYLAKHHPSLEVVNLDALRAGSDVKNVANLPQNFAYRFVKGDIADTNLITQLLKDHDIDTIVHFAAESHVDRSITDPCSFVHSNLLGTYQLLEAARKYWNEVYQLNSQACLFYHISTDEVYGTLGRHDPAFTESTPYAPNSPYSATKAGSDHLVRAYHHTFGLPTLISNCSNNYGPHQNSEKFIPTIIRSCLEEKPIPVYGDGSNIRDWLYVEDHCSAIDLLIQKGVRGETYNVGGNAEQSNMKVVKMICALLDQQKPRASGASYSDLITFVTDRPGHDWRYAINATKLELLGWAPKEDFASGLEKTLAYFLKSARC